MTGQGDRISSLRWRVATMPWPGLFVLMFAGGLSGLAVAEFLFAPRQGGRPSLSFGLVLATVLSAVTTAVLAIRRRRLRAAGRFEATVAAGIALRTGQVPPHPQVRHELRLLLPGQLRLVTGLLRWVPYLLGVLALAQAAVAIGHPRNWFAVVLFAAMAVSYAMWIPRQRRRLDSIAHQLTH